MTSYQSRLSLTHSNATSHTNASRKVTLRIAHSRRRRSEVVSVVRDARR